MADHAKARSEMSLRELTQWAWEGTPPVHRDRRNLLIHLFAVPMFVAAHVLIGAALLTLRPWLLLPGIVMIALSLALQRHGHSLERNAPHPFLGAGDAVKRIYVEQFCNFWRFLFSGQWFAHLRASGRPARDGRSG